jgi:hypothetical protein
LKKSFLKILYPVIVICLTGFTGCPLEPPREAPPPGDKGRMVISIAGGTGGPARTAGPDADGFTKYTLALT